MPAPGLPACILDRVYPGLAAHDWLPAVGRVHRLTAREREILLLLTAGLSNRQIARRLQVTERTVKFHLAQVMEKLGVDSRLRAGLVALIYELHRQACNCEKAPADDSQKG